MVIVIVAHRYGWVPKDQPAKQYKSITWLEFERAAEEGKDVLAFVLDDEGLEQPWPDRSREEYQIAKATREGKATAKLLQETQRNVRQLGKFKSWLNNRAIRAKFTTPEDLRGKVEAALREWTSKATRPRGSASECRHTLVKHAARYPCMSIRNGSIAGLVQKATHRWWVEQPNARDPK